jgi:hypothetical protein
MEKGVFHQSAVADILEERFVEARLHADYKVNADRQLKMTDSIAQPIYLVLDPVTKAVYARFDGASLQSSDPFIEFLNTGWESARPATAAAH